MLYNISKIILSLFFHSYIRLKVVGHRNIPDSGGVILAPNHISYLDPILIALAVKRRVYSMAKEELFKNTFSRFVMINLNAFPVRRGRLDRYTLNRSLAVLHHGNVLNVFPEGTISLSGNTLEGKQGVAWLVLKTNVPVVPVKIIGSDRLLPDGKAFPKMGRASVIFGKPINIDSKDHKHREKRRIITHTIMEEIERLK
ncbi:MAG: lysophospholipid acyltransferase family protein [Thermodesulfobacteriota bacterium]|nr:lysophospholipid acyltransferase family protein [Thermodesulfobacteriota bacterium]